MLIPAHYCLVLNPSYLCDLEPCPPPVTVNPELCPVLATLNPVPLAPGLQAAQRKAVCHLLWW